MLWYLWGATILKICGIFLYFGQVTLTQNPNPGFLWSWPLAYYGVLLHLARDYWTVGDAGEYLIEAITGYLGSSWADWLRWPNEVLVSENGHIS